MDCGKKVNVQLVDRKSTRLNSSHANISYAVFCLKKKNYRQRPLPPRTSLGAGHQHIATTAATAPRATSGSHGTAHTRTRMLSSFVFFFFFYSTAPPRLSPFPPPALSRT